MPDAAGSAGVSVLLEQATKARSKKTMLPSNKVDAAVLIDEILNFFFSIFLPFLCVGQTDTLRGA